MQWQDACQVAAARYVPPLLLLAGGLLGAALTKVPAGAIAVIVIVTACLLSPVPAEVRVVVSSCDKYASDTSLHVQHKV